MAKMGLDLASPFFVEKSEVQFPRYLSLLKAKFQGVSFPLGLLDEMLKAESLYVPLINIISTHPLLQRTALYASQLSSCCSQQAHKELPTVGIFPMFPGVERRLVLH